MVRSKGRHAPDSQMVPAGHWASLVQAWGGAAGVAAGGLAGVACARRRIGSSGLCPPLTGLAVVPNGANTRPASATSEPALAAGAAKTRPRTRITKAATNAGPEPGMRSALPGRFRRGGHGTLAGPL